VPMSGIEGKNDGPLESINLTLADKVSGLKSLDSRRFRVANQGDLLLPDHRNGRRIRKL